VTVNDTGFGVDAGRGEKSVVAVFYQNLFGGDAEVNAADLYGMTGGFAKSRAIGFEGFSETVIYDVGGREGGFAFGKIFVDIGYYVGDNLVGGGFLGRGFGLSRCGFFCVCFFGFWRLYF
jgi:hypothetical protein